MSEENRDNPTPTPTPATNPPTPPSQPQALPPGSIVVASDEWNRLRTDAEELVRFRREQQAILDAKEAERLSAIAEKEGAQSALDAQRMTYEGKLTAADQRIQQIERRMLDAKKSEVISQALAGRVFSGATPEVQAAQAGQIRYLIERDIDAAIDAAGSIVVRDRATGRPADQVIAETLASDAYASFFAARGNGSGTGGGGGDRHAREEPEKRPEPGSLDAIVAEFMAAKKNDGSFGLRPIGR